MDKVIQGILIAVIVLGSGWLGYDLYTQKPVIVEETSEGKVTEETDTLGWQTYRNEEFGFEVQYPQSPYECPFDFEAVCLSAPYIPDILIDPFHYRPEDIGDDFYYEGTCGISFENCIDIIESEYLDGSVSKVEHTVDGQRAIELTGNFNEKIREKMFIIDVGNGALIITQGIFTVEADEIVGHILSTFKFIEPIDTSEWQTYRNKEYGFEFQYPGEFQYLEIQNPDKNKFSLLIINSEKSADVYSSIGVYDKNVRIHLTINLGTLLICRSQEYIKYEIVMKNDGSFSVVDKNTYEETADNCPDGTLFYALSDSSENIKQYDLFLSLITKDDKQQFQEIFEQILSTFKFIE